MGMTAGELGVRMGAGEFERRLLLTQVQHDERKAEEEG